jgi:ferredoxin-NADP reductase
MRARFVKYIWENDARTTVTFYLRPDRPYYFTAGQYADIQIPTADVEHHNMSRTMTYSTSPNDKLLGFTTKFSSPDAVHDSLYKQALLHLQVGDTVNLTDAMGDMVLPLDSSIPLVFVAGGLGIASYVSMVKWLTEQKDPRKITLLYAVRNISDIIFQEEFDDYAAIGSVTKILYTTDHKADDMKWQGEIAKSRLTSEIIMRYAGQDAQVYISGAQNMVNQLQQELQRIHKLPQYRLAFDYFEGYSDL